jgi:hypothetical protein
MEDIDFGLRGLEPRILLGQDSEFRRQLVGTLRALLLFRSTRGSLSGLAGKWREDVNRTRDARSETLTVLRRKPKRNQELYRHYLVQAES